MNHSNQSADNDKKVVCWSTYHKWKYAVNSEQILAWQTWWHTENSEVLKACRIDGMKTTRNGSSGTREHILHGTRNTSAVTDRNMAKTTGNSSTNIGEGIMPKIRNGSSKDFGTKSNPQTDQYIMRFGVWDQGSEKLEMSLAPSITQCGIPTSETNSTTGTCEKP